MCKHCGMMGYFDANTGMAVCPSTKSPEHMARLKLPYACKLLFQARCHPHCCDEEIMTIRIGTGCAVNRSARVQWPARCCVPEHLVMSAHAVPAGAAVDEHPPQDPLGQLAIAGPCSLLACMLANVFRS